jgi:branched-chain amino acid transport system permease protein
VNFWITQTFYGISYAALLFILASGLSLIFGVMRIVNLAHGSYYLLAGYVGYTTMKLTHSFILGIAVSVVAISVVGIFMERLFLRRVPGYALGQVLITVGFALIFQDLALLIWGGEPFTIEAPHLFSGSLVVGHIYLPKYRLLMILVAGIVGTGLWLFERKTRAGSIIRAVVDNVEMARGMGINAPIVSMGVFALGAGVAAIAGVVGGGFLSIYPGLDFEILPYAFVVVILGGRGSLEGAMLGSLIVGLVDNFGKSLFPELSYFTVFAPMVIMLAIRPMGLFGKS